MFSDKAVNNHGIKGATQRLHEITRLSTDDGKSSGALAPVQAGYQY